MAKNNITQYDATAANNTDIDSINIDEGMAASDVNNALRSLMSHLKNVDTGSQALTALSVTGALSCGAFTSNGIDDNADATAITIDISENVGIGDSSPDAKLDVHGNVVFGDGGGFDMNVNGTRHQFSIAGNEHMRIVNDGAVLIAKTVDNTANVGAGFASNGFLGLTRDNGTLLQLNRLTGDGELLRFRQDSATEGNITSSGATISYNAFSGSHWSRLKDNSKPTILKGTIIETIDEMCDWYQAEFTVDDTLTKESISLPLNKKVGDTITYIYKEKEYNAKIIKENDNKHTKCKISDTEDSKRVYGVFASWDNDDDTVNDMYVTAIGTHVVRINKDTTVQAGDLLSSNGDGTAKVQDDDIIRSKTLGKVLTNIKQETYDDGSYTVPCALYCG
jgi:hypothetical protein